MFKRVKRKLSFLYTISILACLIIFIIVLYGFVSKAIKEEEIAELTQYLDKEKHDFIEDLEKGKHKFEYDRSRPIFYYLLSPDQEIVYGKEAIEGFSNELKESKLEKEAKVIKEMDSDNSHILLMKTPLHDDGILIGYAIIGKDITPQKHLIQTILWIFIILTIVFSIFLGLLSYYLAGQAMKPIQQAYLSQKKFVSDASHELRTPLSIFYASLDLLTREEKNRLSDFGQEVVADLKMETTAMRHLIEDLLLLARSDNNQLIIEQKQVDISKLAQSIAKKFALTIPNHLQLISNIEEGLYVIGDAERIQQVIYILLDNAVCYTSEGQITFTVKNIKGYVTIKVSDTGVGIPEQDQSKLFDRFFRSDSARNRTGTGLGLSIAKTIIDAHHGDIKVESKLHEGTTFTILLKLFKN